MDDTPTLRLPQRCLVVLVGPPASGKTMWADAEFPAGAVVSTDRLRGMVGESEDDQAAGADAFDVLDLVVQRRLRRGLVTVVDSLALNDERRRGYIATAAEHGVPCFAVGFDTPARVCRERNKQRGRPIPERVVNNFLKKWNEVRDTLANEGFDAVFAPGRVQLVADRYLDAPDAAARQAAGPLPLRFGLQLSSFTWDGGTEAMAGELAAVAQTAEQAGFSSLWVMDHVRQIPQVGRDWDPMLEAYTTLGYLAAATHSIRLGTLVTGITHRNVALLGKMVATLDALSGGRITCGVGAAWYRKEHEAYGLAFPPAPERFALLEDALRLFPILWGPGSKPFEGAAISVPDTTCYPRPIQDPVPILVGGSGEKRTLRLVAEHADACNLFGEPEVVRHKVEVLAEHCVSLDRDPAEVVVTHLSGVEDAPVADQIGRFRTLAEAGVHEAIVAMPPVATVDAIERFVPVMRAFV